ncbi:MAG: hypothetical protein LBI43_02015 [Streptococcaceae bacterium]|jgi:hypothetical protein|nr:hypothetical protein [Streptococcaceae bacterium]
MQEHVNRNYLPYQSAANYQDGGMKKWMGFMMNEHIDALSDFHDTIDFLDALTFTQKTTILTHLYAQQIPAEFSYREGKKIMQFQGILTDIIGSDLIAKNKNKYKRFALNALCLISPLELEE